MRLNADFDERVVIRPNAYDWVASPAAGVERMMLDRIGDEVARATTIVRFAPDSQFDAHRHGGGEEFLVLEGTFSDEHADYPAGTYVRNPIGTSHTPHIGPDGATILVKLCQFDPADRAQKVVETRSARFEPGPDAGTERLALHRFGAEEVSILRVPSGRSVKVPAASGGAEIFVLEGAIADPIGRYPAGTWLRLPAGEDCAMKAEGPATFYLKTGHLRALA